MNLKEKKSAYPIVLLCTLKVYLKLFQKKTFNNKKLFKLKILNYYAQNPTFLHSILKENTVWSIDKKEGLLDEKWSYKILHLILNFYILNRYYGFYIESTNKP